MKFLKNLSLIAAAMCFLFVVGCGSQNSTSGEEAATEMEATEEAPAMEEAMEAVDSVATAADSVMTEAADSVAAEN